MNVGGVHPDKSVKSCDYLDIRALYYECWLILSMVYLVVRWDMLLCRRK